MVHTLVGYLLEDHTALESCPGAFFLRQLRNSRRPRLNRHIFAALSLACVLSFSPNRSVAQGPLSSTYQSPFQSLPMPGQDPIPPSEWTYHLGQNGVGTKATDVTPHGTERQDAPIVSMFPHPEDAIYWISGQANIIFQGRPAFHSLYEGPNSFRNSAEYKNSMVGT